MTTYIIPLTRLERALRDRHSPAGTLKRALDDSDFTFALVVMSVIDQFDSCFFENEVNDSSLEGFESVLEELFPYYEGEPGQDPFEGFTAMTELLLADLWGVFDQLGFDRRNPPKLNCDRLIGACDLTELAAVVKTQALSPSLIHRGLMPWGP